MRRLTPTRARAPGLSRDGLESWLLAHPPASLVPLADRLLIAAVDRTRAEGPTLAKNSLPHLVTAAQHPEAATQLTTLAVCLACADDLGHDSPDLRFSLAVISKAVNVDAFAEPFRCTSRYWLWRAALRAEAPTIVDDDAPADRLLAFMFHSHRVLFASGYGKDPVSGNAATGLEQAMQLVDLDDGDQVALLLLCFACVTPKPNVGPLLAKLGTLQVKNGSLRTRLEDPVARHHAVCVAALACSLLFERANAPNK